MGCSRKRFNLFNKACHYAIKRDWKQWALNFKHYFWVDSFMPIYCKLVGHDKYKPDANENIMACKRCHQYV